MKIILFLSGLIALAYLPSCIKDKTSVFTPSCEDTVSYSIVAVPFIEQNCSTSGCHDAVTASGGHSMTSHANVSSSIDDMIVAMSAGTMPLGGSAIPDSVIQLFDCWVQQGKLDN